MPFFSSWLFAHHLPNTSIVKTARRSRQIGCAILIELLQLYGYNRFNFIIDLNCILLAFFASHYLFWLKIETITWKLGQNFFKGKSFARCLYTFKAHFHDNNVRQIHFYGPLFVQLCSARTTALPPCNRYSKIFWWKKRSDYKIHIIHNTKISYTQV